MNIFFKTKKWQLVIGLGWKEVAERYLFGTRQQKKKKPKKHKFPIFAGEKRTTIKKIIWTQLPFAEEVLFGFVGVFFLHSFDLIHWPFLVDNSSIILTDGRVTLRWWWLFRKNKQWFVSNNYAWLPVFCALLIYIYIYILLWDMETCVWWRIPHNNDNTIWLSHKRTGNVVHRENVYRPPTNARNVFQ